MRHEHVEQAVAAAAGEVLHQRGHIGDEPIVGSELQLSLSHGPS